MMRVRPLQLPPPLRLPSASSRFSSPKQSSSSPKNSKQGSSSSKRALLPTQQQQQQQQGSGDGANGGDDDEEEEEEEDGEGDLEAAISSSPLWSPGGLSARWGKAMSFKKGGSSKLELPDLSSLPMSPSNTLRAARTMAHRLEAEKTGQRALLRGPPLSPPRRGLTFLPMAQSTSALPLGDQQSSSAALLSPRAVPSSKRHHFKRAYYGTLLSIIERPKCENRCLSAASNYAWPLLEIAIEFVQFSLFNTYVLPPAVNSALAQRVAAMVQALVLLQQQHSYLSFTGRSTTTTTTQQRSSSSGSSLVLFAVSVSLVGAIVVSLIILALQFGRKGKRSSSGEEEERRRRRSLNAASVACTATTCTPTTSAMMSSTTTCIANSNQPTSFSSLSLHQPLASYINFVSGALYIPLLNVLSLQFLAALETRPGTATTLTAAAVLLLCLAFLVPFSLFVSQNQGYIRDEHAFHLRKRRHNRLNLLVIAVKTVGIIAVRGLGRQPQQDNSNNTAAAGGGGGGDPLNRAAIVANMLLFSVLLLAHLLTNVYYHASVNRAYAGLYLCLVWGAACRVFTMTHQQQHQDYDNIRTGVAEEQAYWIFLLPVLVLGWVVQVLSEHVAVLHHWRYSINTFAIKWLSMLDLADNADVIYRYDLSGLLRSATRMGAYARFLAEHDPDDPQVERLFLKALKQEPKNAEILGGYADYLINQAGRDEEAARFYQRAVEADPDNRENLEGYAKFLSERNSPDALYYYQRSLLQYYQHYEYRDLYANAMEPMTILDANATILDCNGAALLFFRARRRHQMCGRPRFMLELVQECHVEGFRHKLRDVLFRKGGLNSFSFEATVVTFTRQEVPVQVVFSRMKHGGTSVVHMALKDMTALRHVHERLAKAELKYRQLELLHKLTSQAEHRELSRQLFEHGATCHVLASLPKLLIDRCSTGAEAALGLSSRKALLGAPLSALVPPDVLQDYVASLPKDFDNSTTSITKKNSAQYSYRHHHNSNSGASPLQQQLAQHQQGGGVASPRPQYEQLPTRELDVRLRTTTTTPHGHSSSYKTFSARLAAVAVGEGGARYILLSLHDNSRFYPTTTSSTPRPSPSSPSPPHAFLDLCPRPASPPPPPDAGVLSALSHALCERHPLPLLMVDQHGTIQTYNTHALVLLLEEKEEEEASLTGRKLSALLLLKTRRHEHEEEEEEDKSGNNAAHQQQRQQQQWVRRLFQQEGGGTHEDEEAAATVTAGDRSNSMMTSPPVHVIEEEEVWVLGRDGAPLLSHPPMRVEVLPLGHHHNNNGARFLLLLYPAAPPSPSATSACLSPVLFTPAPPPLSGSPHQPQVPAIVPPLPVVRLQQQPQQQPHYYSHHYGQQQQQQHYYSHHHHPPPSAAAAAAYGAQDHHHHHHHLLPPLCKKQPPTTSTTTDYEEAPLPLSPHHHYHHHHHHGGASTSSSSPQEEVPPPSTPPPPPPSSPAVAAPPQQQHQHQQHPQEEDQVASPRACHDEKEDPHQGHDDDATAGGKVVEEYDSLYQAFQDEYSYPPDYDLESTFKESTTLQQAANTLPPHLLKQPPPPQDDAEHHHHHSSRSSEEPGA